MKKSFSKFSSEETYDLVVFGLPRSGNTYFSYNLRFAFPKLNIGSHVHNFNSINSVGLETGLVVIVRNPRDVVASWIELLMAETDLKDLELENHLVSRIKWLSRNFKILESREFKEKNKKIILHFEDFTKDLNTCNLKIEKKFNLTGRKDVEQETLKEYLKLQDKLNLGSDYQYKSHVPRDRIVENLEVNTIKDKIMSSEQVKLVLTEMEEFFFSLEIG